MTMFLVAKTLLVLVVLDGGLEQVTPLLVAGPPGLKVVRQPGNAVATRAVAQTVLHRKKIIELKSNACTYCPRSSDLFYIVTYYRVSRK